MRLIATTAAIVFVVIGAYGQAPPAFEVASVRQNRSGSRDRSMDISRGGERFTATNVPFGALVLMAYNITVRQLSGPGEFLSDRYDVAAKAEHPVSRDEMLRMLQALLADRFKLVIRHETKEVPVYALTIGKGGPKLHQSEPPESEGGGVLRNPFRAGGEEPRSGRLIFKAESMPDFAWALSRMAGIGDRVVVDRTGLKGNYDFELTFGRDVAPPGGDAAEPSVFIAVQEQLGLKLESTKAPVEFLTIDHVERPSGN
jgi:uncharacterized protein (TIGR03435 family)